MTATASQPVATVAALLRAVAAGDTDAVVRHVHPDRFVRHEPGVGDGVDGLRGRAVRATDAGIEVVRTLADGDLAVAHGRDALSALAIDANAVGA